MHRRVFRRLDNEAACRISATADLRDVTQGGTADAGAARLDLDAFEANLRTMADDCRRAKIAFRPHAKTNSSHIARRQMDAGAACIRVATVPEAEAMAAAGISGILLDLADCPAREDCPHGGAGSEACGDSVVRRPRRMKSSC